MTEFSTRMTGRPWCEVDEDVLSPDYPMELVDEELRAMGLDPEEVAAAGRRIAAYAEWLTSPNPAPHDYGDATTHVDGGEESRNSLMAWLSTEAHWDLNRGYALYFVYDLLLMSLLGWSSLPLCPGESRTDEYAENDAVYQPNETWAHVGLLLAICGRTDR